MKVWNLYVTYKLLTEFAIGQRRGDHIETCATQADAVAYIRAYAENPHIVKEWQEMRGEWNVYAVEYTTDYKGKLPQKEVYGRTWVAIESDLWEAGK